MVNVACLSRPMYHYETTSAVGGVTAMGPTVAPGFSAINLSVKIAAAQAQRPHSPTLRDPRDPRPAIDLSTSSGSPQVRTTLTIIIKKLFNQTSKLFIVCYIAIICLN